MRLRASKGRAVCLSVLTVLLVGNSSLAAGDIEFKDVEQQSRQFIGPDFNGKSL